MLTNITVLWLLICGTAGLTFFFKKKFEECIPITFMVIMLVEFLFGIMGILKIGFYVSTILLILFCVVAIFLSIRKSTFRSNIVLLFTPGFIVFVITFLFLSVINVGKLASSWDEFSHWMDIVKVTTSIDDFGTNPNSHSMFKSYPPAMALVQYFVQKIHILLHGEVGFSEWRAYFAYQIFSLSFFFPFFKNFSFKNPVENFLVSVSYFLCIMFLFGGFYFSVYIDAVLSIVTGCTIASIMLQENKKELLYTVRVFFSCATLVLLKDAGMLFACFIIAIYLISIYESDFLKKRNLILSACALFALLLPKLLWKIELTTSHAYISFGKKISPLVLLNVLVGKDVSYRREVLVNYCKAFFQREVTIGYTGIKINYVIFLLICINLIFVVYYLIKKDSDTKYEERRAKSICVLIVVMVVVYVIGLLNTYMINFSEYEAVNCASFSRYLNICFASTEVFFILVFTQKKLFQEKSIYKSLLIFTLIFVLIPSKDLALFLSRGSVHNSAAIRSLYIPLGEEIKKNCKAGDRIYFISQYDTGFDSLVTAFDARPAVVVNNGAWSLGIPESSDDIYTQNINYKDWQKILVDGYDFVALYKINETFIQEYAPLFEDEILNNRVYKVNKKTGVLSVCQ